MAKEKKAKSPLRRIITIVLILLALLLAAALLIWSGLLPSPAFSAEHFGIETLLSENDADGDGIDDYTDILLGARADAENKPGYDGSYFDGGYPPDDKGVCTDVVWRAFQSAGYDLKAMIDADIAANVALYPRTEGRPDPNIDFRRVPNLRVFFDRHAQSLTTDLAAIAEWQPGDIVIFGRNKHIGIVSDKRNWRGVPFLIHNSGQPRREEDVLWLLAQVQGVTAHYRYIA